MVVSESERSGTRGTRGRYAPSPTGLLHIGNARTALVAWLSARSRHGTFVLRMEDLDPPRVIPGAEEQIMKDLDWMGLDWEEGPDVGGAFAPYRQSERLDRYRDALVELVAMNAVYPCRVSRKELRNLASAPHGTGEIAFPDALRPTVFPVDWFDRFGEQGEQAVRFRVPAGLTGFDDLLRGFVSQDVSKETGDFVLRRRDGLFAYQLAVVVDDIEMQITEVVRGDDILPSTGRQLILRDRLGGLPCAHGHLPLMLNEAGDKLSKRDESLTVLAIREAGISADQLVGYLAWTLGLLPSPRRTSAAALVSSFDWARISPENVVVGADIVRRMKGI